MESLPASLYRLPTVTARSNRAIDPTPALHSMPCHPRSFYKSATLAYPSTGPTGVGIAADHPARTPPAKHRTPHGRTEVPLRIRGAPSTARGSDCLAPTRSARPDPRSQATGQTPGDFNRAKPAHPGRSAPHADRGSRHLPPQTRSAWADRRPDRLQWPPRAPPRKPSVRRRNPPSGRGDFCSATVYIGVHPN
jgi:hypothetical protein